MFATLQGQHPYQQLPKPGHHWPPTCGHRAVLLVGLHGVPALLPLLLLLLLLEVLSLRQRDGRMVRLRHHQHLVVWGSRGSGASGCDRSAMWSEGMPLRVYEQAGPWPVHQSAQRACRHLHMTVGDGHMAPGLLPISRSPGWITNLRGV